MSTFPGPLAGTSTHLAELCVACPPAPALDESTVGDHFPTRVTRRSQHLELNVDVARLILGDPSQELDRLDGPPRGNQLPGLLVRVSSDNASIAGMDCTTGGAACVDNRKGSAVLGAT